jgi:hypothetical protein
MRLVGDDLQEPGPERRSRSKAIERIVCLDKAGLRRIFGGFRIARPKIGGPEGKLLIPAYELLVGLHVAPLGSRHEFSLVQWSAPHGLILICPTPPAPIRFPRL